MFALAANGFNKPSETFIRAHARGLAPGNTLLVAERRELERPITAPLILVSKRLPILITDHGGLGQVLRGLLRPSRLITSRSGYLAELFQQMQVTTLMVEYGVCALPLMEAAERAGVDLFVHFHGVDASTALNDPAIRAGYQQLFKTAKGVIGPSRFITDKLRAAGCPPDKLHVVPCGVDISQITPTASDGANLLAVGRMTEKKAPLTTVAAFAQIKAQHPSATLTMLGDGPLYAAAQAEVARLGLQDAVTLPGMVTQAEVRAAMARASVFLQHSVTAENGDVEGLPVAILEAMAAGLPVVATQHSGIPEAVCDGETGHLVPEHDVDAMADRALDLVTNPPKAKAFGAAGRDHVENAFTIDITNCKLRAIMGLPDPAE